MVTYYINVYIKVNNAEFEMIWIIERFTNK